MYLLDLLFLNLLDVFLVGGVEGEERRELRRRMLAVGEALEEWRCELVAGYLYPPTADIFWICPRFEG